MGGPACLSFEHFTAPAFVLWASEDRLFGAIGQLAADIDKGAAIRVEPGQAETIWVEPL